LQACSNVCVDPRFDPFNCGACGTTCSAGANSDSACVNSVCQAFCRGGFLNCDGQPSNGCEINGQGDLSNCGACGNACPAVANGTRVCSAGICGIASCNSGWGNCDGNATNGCETNTQTSAANCGVCGRACPSGQICSAGVCNVACTPGSATFNYTGSIVSFTVPSGCSTIRIQAAGAQGGSANQPGGLGAQMAGTFTVTPGQVLSILVGQQPPTGNGGGGGTFVVNAGSGVPLIVAGAGGGGAGECCGGQVAGAPGVTATNGTAGTSPGCTGGAGGTGGAADNGGAGTTNGSGGGGGLVNNGTNGTGGSPNGLGGASFRNGGAGGTGATPGGFGGGGGSSNNGGWQMGAGGGGGGYAGGGGSCGASQWGSGGGGGSYNAGASQSNSSGTRSGHGQVIVTW
jgi:hypothetical protein